MALAKKVRAAKALVKLAVCNAIKTGRLAMYDNTDNWRMFDGLAHRYDLSTTVLAFGIDHLLLDYLAKRIGRDAPGHVLDIATGTAALPPRLLKYGAGFERMTGLDLSPGMLAVARRKLSATGLDERVELIQGDAAALPFEDSMFDAVTMTFGLRNLENIEVSLAEQYRVLKPGGTLWLLELTTPKTPVIQTLHRLYLRYPASWLGGLLTGDYPAYRYLRESIFQFPARNEFLPYLKNAGFTNAAFKDFVFGAMVMYHAQKG